MDGEQTYGEGLGVDEKLDVTLQYVLAVQKADCIVDCIKSSVASMLREGILLPSLV